MLNRGSNIFVCVLLMIFLVSCDKYKSYNPKEINGIRNNAILMSQSIIGEQKYWQVYQEMSDSVKIWIENNIGYYQYLNQSKRYEIDSLICFNAEGDKFITCLLLQQMLTSGVQDDIEYVYGVQIKNQWYFFGGPTLVLPREYYQEDIHTPLSFDQLKQIAAKNIYQGYLRKKIFGKLEINKHFFSDITSGAWCGDCTTQAEWDSVYLSVISRNWSRRDTINNN